VFAVAVVVVVVGGLGAGPGRGEGRAPAAIDIAASSLRGSAGADVHKTHPDRDHE
jgi:hypothetical protein